MRLFALFFLLSTTLACTQVPQDQGRMSQDPSGSGIVGGKITNKKSQLASMVVMISLIGKNGSPEFCTGTFISEKLILTAAHCVNDDISQMNVIFDTNPMGNEDFKSLDITATLRHPRAHIQKERNDIALIQFRGGLPKGATTADLLSPGLDEAEPKTFLAVGYGRTHGKVEVGNDELVGAGRLREVNLWTFYDPEKPYFDVDQTPGKGVCFGDSGGPAFRENSDDARMTIIGVASGVFNAPNAPEEKSYFDFCKQRSRYVNVIQYLDWIEDAKTILRRSMGRARF